MQWRYSRRAVQAGEPMTAQVRGRTRSPTAPGPQRLALLPLRTPPPQPAIADTIRRISLGAGRRSGEPFTSSWSGFGPHSCSVQGSPATNQIRRLDPRIRD